MHYKWIQYIDKGSFNCNLSSDDTIRSLKALEILTKETSNGSSHRLSVNYSVQRMNYNKMHIYGVIWDMKKDRPVCCSGLQNMGRAGRLLSRYYVFKEYRTIGNTFTNDIDDYQMMKIQKECNDFDVLFISRDTNTKYFERLKKYRSDVYGGFEIYPEKIELLYKDNWQNIFYYGDKTAIECLTFQYITAATK